MRETEGSHVAVKFATRLCEFFAIDMNEDFVIWNMQKFTHKPAH